MNIVCDLDGTICSIKQEDQDYKHVVLLPGARERLRELRRAGHRVVIYTARGMESNGGSMGRLMKSVGGTTLEWLRKHEIEYDEIYFGKPNCHVYIDDRAVRFETWDEVTGEILERYARAR